MFARVAAAALVVVGLSVLLPPLHPSAPDPLDDATVLSRVSESKPVVCDLGSLAAGAPELVGPPDVHKFIECLRVNGAAGDSLGPHSG